MMEPRSSSTVVAPPGPLAPACPACADSRLELMQPDQVDPLRVLGYCPECGGIYSVDHADGDGAWSVGGCIGRFAAG